MGEPPAVAGADQIHIYVSMRPEIIATGDLAKHVLC